MASKIESESEEEHFEHFMKLDKPKINFSDAAPSTSASKLSLLHEEENDKETVASKFKTVKKKRERVLRSNKKQTNAKKTVKKQKLQAEVIEETDIDVEVGKPNNESRLKAPSKSIKQKESEMICLSDEDCGSPMHNYRLRRKCPKINDEEVVIVASSPGEIIPIIGEEEAVGHLPTLEAVQEELEIDTDYCDCCKLEKNNCPKKLKKEEDQKSLLENLKALQAFNHNTEKCILQQHRNLLKHPEMDSLCNSIDNSKTNNFLTKEKREWVEKFMNSMVADRIDYNKPGQVNSVQGLQHSSVETNTPVSETDHLTDSTMIVKRIDFEKEKRARYSQLLEQQRSWLIKEPATPSFCTNHLGVTSTPIVDNGVLPNEHRKLDEENNIDLSKLDFSFVTLRTPMKSNANEEHKTSQAVIENTTNREEIRTSPVNESREDLQIITPADPPSLPESSCQNLNQSSYIPRHLRPRTAPMNEEQIMNFVDDLLGAETQVITQLVNENFDRIMKYNETSRIPTANNVINLVDDIYNSATEDSVILIDDNLNTEDENEIQILDDTSPIVIEDSSFTDVPSTSRRPKRTKGISKCHHQKRSRISPAVVDKANSESPEKTSKGKRDCPICLECLDKKEISSTTCGHIFCTPCIKEAIKLTKKCPNCRKGLNLKKIHPLYL